jgi:hypothetical protein
MKKIPVVVGQIRLALFRLFGVLPSSWAGREGASDFAAEAAADEVDVLLDAAIELEDETTLDMVLTTPDSVLPGGRLDSVRTAMAEELRRAGFDPRLATLPAAGADDLKLDDVFFSVGLEADAAEVPPPTDSPRSTPPLEEIEEAEEEEEEDAIISDSVLYVALSIAEGREEVPSKCLHFLKMLF